MPGFPFYRRIVEVLADNGPGAARRWTLASGLLVRQGIVLTSAHALTSDEIYVRFLIPEDSTENEGEASEARLSGDSAGDGSTVWKLKCSAQIIDRGDVATADIALLRVAPSDQVDAGLGDVPPMDFATVNRQTVSAQKIDDCVAAGFPAFSEIPGSSGDAPAQNPVVRELVQVFGHIPVLDSLVSGLLTLRADRSPRPLPRREQALGASPWAGMSGAVVVAGSSYVVGVISEHHPRAGDSDLTVTPLTQFTRLPKGRAETWWEALGISPAELLEIPETSSGTRVRLRPSAKANDGSHYREPIWLPVPRRDDVVGREEILSAMWRDLRTSRSLAGPVRACVLHGLGGAGKTTIANEFAFRHWLSGDYGLVWWIRGGDAAGMSLQFRELLTAQLGLREAIAEDNVIALLHATLAGRQDGWLLIFDDVEDQETLNGIVPVAGHGTVVVTSRNPDWHGPSMYEVTSLDIGVARDFLISRSGDADLKSAGLLADELGALPLALEQAGAYVRSTPTASLSTYLAMYRDQRGRALSLGRAFGHPDTVQTTWRLAFDALPPRAAGMLRLVSCFGPDSIPLELMLRFGRSSIERLAASDRADIAQLLLPLASDPVELGEALSALHRYSLLRSEARPGSSFTIGGGEPQVLTLASCHRLVQAVTFDDIADSQRETWRRIAGQLLYSVFPDNPDDPGTWSWCGLLAAHVSEGKAIHVGETLALTAQYLHAIGDYQEASRLSRALLDFQARETGPKSAEYARWLLTYARDVGEIGRVNESLDLEREAAEILKTTFGPESRETLAAMANLAVSLSEVGATDESAELEKTVLDASNRLFGPQDTLTLKTAVNHANRLLDLGDLAGAIALDEQTIPRLVERYGRHARATMMARSNHANRLAKSGDALRAYEITSEVLADQTDVLGPEHPETLMTMMNLANRLGDLGHLSEEEAIRSEALAASERVLGADHPQTILGHNARLSRWLELGRPDDVIRDGNALVERIAPRLGETHLRTMSALESLGKAYAMSGDYIMARAVYERCVTAACRRSGSAHQLTRAFMGELWKIYARLGQLDRGAIFMRRLGLLVTPFDRSDVDFGVEERITAACSAGDYDTAVAIADNMVQAAMSFEAPSGAVEWISRKLEFGILAGWGEWARLRVQTDLLNVLQRLGRSQDILRLALELRDTAIDLRDSEAPTEISEPWRLREYVLDRGRLAAAVLGRFELALELNGDIARSMQARGATRRDVAYSRYNDFYILLVLGRLDEAELLLEWCRDAYSQAGDTRQLSIVFSARAAIAAERDDLQSAVRLAHEGLRLAYLGPDPSDIAGMHVNLAGYLKGQGSAETGRAHEIASGSIYMALAKMPGATGHGSMHPPDPESAGSQLSDLLAIVEREDGIRFGDLISDLAGGHAAVARVVAAVTAELDSPTSEARPGGVEEPDELWEPVLAGLLAASRHNQRAAELVDSFLDSRQHFPGSRRVVERLQAFREGLRDYRGLVSGLSADESAIVARALLAIRGDIGLTATTDDLQRLIIGQQFWSTISERLAAAAGQDYAPENAWRGNSAQDLVGYVRKNAKSAGGLRHGGNRRDALALTLRAAFAVLEYIRFNESVLAIHLFELLEEAGRDLANLGRSTDALTVFGLAADVARWIVDSGRSDLTYLVGSALNYRALVLSMLGRIQDELETAQESAELLRGSPSPGGHNVQLELASALSVIASVHRSQGYLADAAQATRDVVEIRRRLAAVDPDGHEASLADALVDLSRILVDIGEFDEAAQTARLAVDIRRRQASAEDGIPGPDLANALYHLGGRLSRIGQLEEAVAITIEVVSIYRSLAQADPPAYDSHLADALSNLSGQLGNTGRLGEGLEAIEESVAIFRRLAVEDPDHYEPMLRHRLPNLAAILWHLGRREEAMTVATDVVEKWQDMAAAETERKEFEFLAIALNNLCGMLYETGPEDVLAERLYQLSLTRGKIAAIAEAEQAHEVAIRSYEEAISDLERLLDAEPGNAKYLSSGSAVCARLGDLLYAKGDFRDAWEYYVAAFLAKARQADAEDGSEARLNEVAEIMERIAALELTECDAQRWAEVVATAVRARRMVFDADPASMVRAEGLAYALQLLCMATPSDSADLCTQMMGVLEPFDSNGSLSPTGRDMLIWARQRHTEASSAVSEN